MLARIFLIPACFCAALLHALPSQADTPNTVLRESQKRPEDIKFPQACAAPRQLLEISPTLVKQFHIDSRSWIARQQTSQQASACYKV